MDGGKWSFQFEVLTDGTWRITFDDNFVIWGYGDTPREALINLMENSEELDEEYE